jgi:acyl-CoA thioesterase-1
MAPCGAQSHVPRRGGPAYLRPVPARADGRHGQALYDHAEITILRDLMRLLLGLVCLAFALFTAVPSASAAESDGRSWRYVAIGASDSLGVGATDPDREGWVPRLAGLLGPETEVVNLGVSGALLEDGLRELPLAVRADPDLVTVWMCVNDFKALVPLSMYAGQLDAVLGELRQNTKARVLVANLPDLTRVTVFASVIAFLGLDPTPVRSEVVRWNGAIAHVVDKHGATLVDLHAAWRELEQHPEYVSEDGFHPSTAGYARLAELFHAAAVPASSWS